MNNVNPSTVTNAVNQQKTSVTGQGRSTSAAEMQSIFNEASRGNNGAQITKNTPTDLLAKLKAELGEGRTEIDKRTGNHTITYENGITIYYNDATRDGAGHIALHQRGADGSEFYAEVQTNETGNAKNGSQSDEAVIIENDGQGRSDVQDYRFGATTTRNHTETSSIESRVTRLQNGSYNVQSTTTGTSRSWS